MYIDVHCHLTGDEFDDVGGIESVLARAKDAGVERIVCSGYDLASSKVAAELASLHSEVYFTAGFHPSELGKYRDGDLEELKNLCRADKCVAVGEIGLDYHFEDNPAPDFQKELFIKQLILADELGLPVVLHSRDAASETLDILIAHASLLSRGGLMHCYSYSPEMAERYEKLGLYFSFGGPITFKNSKKAQESVQRIPAYRILSETDCPYLTPVPFRGSFPNEPKNVVYAVEKLAQLKGVSIEVMRAQIIENAKKLFFKLR